MTHRGWPFSMIANCSSAAATANFIERQANTRPQKHSRFTIAPRSVLLNQA
jgi:hypothetical protein